MYILQEFDDLLSQILNDGFKIPNRTGIDCFTLFGSQITVNIDKYFPIPTKRKYASKSIIAELQWMLSGSTNVNDLIALNSNIWTPWKDKKFEEANNYEDGDFGPIYGFQIRHFGGDYSNKENPGGFDQIKFMVDELRTNKFSRRIIMNLWNPLDVLSSRVRLPPCHFATQALVDDKDRLTLILSQRSADVPVGSPANIIFYSALCYMLAQQTNLTPYKLIYNMGSAHIYENQIDAVKKYLSRKEYSSPKLELNKAKDIFSYTKDDFKIIDYNSGDKLTIPVAV